MKDCCESKADVQISANTNKLVSKPLQIKKEKLVTATGSLSGGLSILSSYNVCHSICMGVIAMLSVFGIAVAGFPLAFLLPYQIYFWIIGIAILAVALILYKIKGSCISKHMILANAGLLISGIPLTKSQFSSYLLLTIGMIIVAIAVALYLKEKKWTKK